MSKTSERIVKKVNDLFESLQQGISDADYINACDELAELFDASAEAKREELEKEEE